MSEVRTDPWGIQSGYHDVWGNWTEPSPAARTAIRRSMGAATDDAAEVPPAGVPLHVVPHRSGDPLPPVAEGSTLVLEDGTELTVGDDGLPHDLPLGYHRLELAAGRGPAQLEHLVVVPRRAHLPAMRAWGLTAQLYAARSRRSWGMGDLGDLATVAAWATERGAATIGLNPLHANAPGGPPANSPYSPSSRRWLDPIYLDVAALAAEAGLPGLDASLAVGARLNDTDRIDRAATWTLKLHVLEQLWAQRGRDPEFEAYVADHGRALERWGTYCAIAEHHGPSWTSWPTELRHPSQPAVARWASDRMERVAFWSWLQHLTERQLHAAGSRDWLVTDLAVGFAADGFDAWEWQGELALGTRIGAPPDLLGPDGQDWGLPPFIPDRARSLAYRPIAETLRANLRHGAGIRIDHVMGLLRLYWIPPELDASDGAYVAWHGHELLDIVALESVRAGALVIGEDLGTVDDAIRSALGGRGILSTRLLWFEDDAPEQWPAQAMAAVTTHDLPTIAGVWSGVDLADQVAAGVTTPVDGDELFRHRLRVAAASDDARPLDDLVVDVHRRLAQAPSMLVTAALDDVVGAEHRPNIPGTIDEHPNWRIPLPVPVDELGSHPLASRVASAVAEAGRGGEA